MADNVTSPVTSGTILATDEIGGVHYPRQKVAFGVDGAVVDASTTNPLPIDTVVRAVATSRSATVGTSASQLMAANASRRGFVIQNQSATASIYINGLGTAVADKTSFRILPGQTYETTAFHVGTGAISIISTEAATEVYAREF